MAEMAAEVLTEAVVYDRGGAVIARLPQQDIVAIRVTNARTGTRAVLIVERALLERDGVVRVRG